MKSGLDKDRDAAPSGQTIFSLLHAAHALEDKVEAALGSVGLSSPKFSVLNALVQAKEAQSLGDLANKLSCVKSNMTQLIDRLETDGLVKRVPDPSDRRAVRAEITAKGREKQEAGTKVIGDLESEFAGAVSPADRAAFGRLLTAIG